MTNSIPRSSLHMLVGIVVLSIVFLLLSLLTVWMLCSRGQKFNYITLFSIFISFSTILATIETIRYGVIWRQYKQMEYENAIASLEKPTLGLGSPPDYTDRVLYFIRLSCHNTEAILVLCFTLSLYHSTHFTPLPIQTETILTNSSKIFAIIAPAILVGLANLDSLATNIALFIFLTDSLMLVSIAIGAVFLALLVGRYIRTRKTMAASANVPSDDSTIHRVRSKFRLKKSPRESIYDHGLLIRFAIAFLAMGGLTIRVVTYQISSLSHARTLAAKPGPDFSSHAINADILSFLPQAAASMAVFLIFGTSRGWREYRDLILSRKKKNPGPNDMGVDLENTYPVADGGGRGARESVGKYIGARESNENEFYEDEHGRIRLVER